MLYWHSICQGLHKIFPEKSAEEFKRHLIEGRGKKSRHWAVYGSRIDYNTFTEVKALPIFRLTPYKSGFHWEEYNARTRTYGSLAGRTIGAMFGAKDTARFSPPAQTMAGLPDGLTASMAVAPVRVSSSP